jgi:hypothetical protein
MRRARALIHFAYLAPVNSVARKKELCPYEEFVEFVPII